MAAARSEFYYNALIQNKDGADNVIGPMVAAFAEMRAIPILQDTSNWNVGLARLSTFGATLNLPLWEPALLPGSDNATQYVFTLSARSVSLPVPYIDITASNNAMTLTTSRIIGNYTFHYNTYPLTIPVATYSEASLATALTKAMCAVPGFGAVDAPSVCSWSSSTGRWTINVRVDPTSAVAAAASTITVGPTSRSIIFYAIAPPPGGGANYITSTTTLSIPVGSYTQQGLIDALNALFLSPIVLGDNKLTARATTNPDAPSVKPGGRMCIDISTADGSSREAGLVISDQSTLLTLLGEEGWGTKNFRLWGSPKNQSYVAPAYFGYNIGFTNSGLASSSLSALMGFNATVDGAQSYSQTFDTKTGVTTLDPILSPVFAGSSTGVSPTFQASAPVIWIPQHVGNPRYRNMCSSYQYVCRLVNECFATIMENLNVQLRLWSGDPARQFTTAAPTLQYQNGIYSLVVGANFGVSPKLENFTIAKNLACANWLPFPALVNYDFDANTAYSALGNPRLTSGTVILDNSGMYSNDSGVTYLISQEYDASANWCPYIGLTITTSTIPSMSEMFGKSLITLGTVSPTIGEASAAVLFDMDLTGDSAHSYLNGISFSPTIMRFNSLTGSSLSTIAFQVFLRRRDGSLDPWDVPKYGCLDLKLLFQRSD